MLDKKILLVTTYHPFSHKTGAHQRTYNLYVALKKIVKVKVLFFNIYHEKIPFTSDDIIVHDVEKGIGLLDKIYTSCLINSDQFLIKRNLQCAKIYKNICMEYDYVFFRYITTAIMCGVSDYKNVYIDVDDIPWHIYRLMSTSPFYSLIKRAYYRYKYYFIKRRCRKIFNSCKRYFVANPNDVYDSKAIYLPNIPTNMESDDCELTYNKNIIFVGFLGYPPNYQGLDLFINNVWMNVIDKNPDSHLYIVGKGLVERLRKSWEQYPNIHILGFVEDLVATYRQCAIAICPIYSGAGTNIKVLEALAMKKITVASCFAMKGFEKDLHHKEEILIANSYTEFSAILNDVLESMAQYKVMVENGYQVVRNNYTTEAFEDILKHTLI